METQTRYRPELPPVYTGRDQHPGYLKPSPYSATSPVYSASVNLPSPMYKISPGYDQSMRSHERALLDRLDPRARREAQSSPATASPLTPVREQASNARRDSVTSLPAPRPAASSSPGVAQYSPLAATAREILLAGMPDGLPRPLPATTQAATSRRQSLPLSFSSARRNSQQLWAEIKAWDRVFCVVSAVPLYLRRPSDSSSADDGGAEKGRLPAWGNRVTIRARVRPCALNRKPFLLKRTFDRDALSPPSSERSPASAGLRRPSTAELTSRTRVPISRRRSPMAVSREHSSDLDWSSVQSSNTVPIHMKYARRHFPVLAALLYSRHIQPGDIIDLPLPYPEAWGQTVAYVYTAEGELTEAVKQNILYLGGKV